MSDYYGVHNTLLSISSSHEPGTSFLIGETPVTYTAVDLAGNINTQTFIVVIIGEYPLYIAAGFCNILMQSFLKFNIFAGKCEEIILDLFRICTGSSFTKRYSWLCGYSASMILFQLLNWLCGTMYSINRQIIRTIKINLDSVF